ncbi:Alpha/beta hydrolase family-domain-containing protein [Mycena pura]|uniref:Alpha/beta hydrolase family-domain-containing protein n=1 Tax=Mycena pura TaxID=153505 RepID=A0AAD6VL72_9AGAR|nr:Alpha/beta hydrolase family-domain-containing protein [Mycena pura]
MTSLASESYVFDPRPNFPLLLTAKRYWHPASPHLNDPSAFTLIFAHATGFHKEQYEPTIEDLYRLIPPGGPNIREAWSIDCPNHGDAAVLNEETLRWGYDEQFGWQEYARGIHAFLTGLGTGVDIDFTTRRLVLVGHSFSAVVQVFSLTFQPLLKPECLILLEIMCIRPSAVAPLMQVYTTVSDNRRDIWSSREEAYQEFKARAPWKRWDERVLRTYVEHGLRPLPTLEYPDKTGVTLKCIRRHESAVYRDTLASFFVYRLMNWLVKHIPTHFIYGAVDDLIPRDVKDEFLANQVGGEQNLSSLTRLPGAGHLLVQTHPEALAKTISERTETRPSSCRGRGRHGITKTVEDAEMPQRGKRAEEPPKGLVGEDGESTDTWRTTSSVTKTLKNKRNLAIGPGHYVLTPSGIE